MGWRRQALAGTLGKVTGAAVIVVHPALAPVMEALAPLAEAMHGMLAEARMYAVTHQHLQAVFLGIVIFGETGGRSFIYFQF